MKCGHEITVFDNLSTGLQQNLFKQNKFVYGNILEKDIYSEAGGSYNYLEEDYKIESDFPVNKRISGIVENLD